MHRRSVCLLLWLSLALPMVLPPISTAQFMYLDCNGDELSSSADRLGMVGETTDVWVYLDTSHNADSTAAICHTGQEALTLNSYSVIVRADGGTVSFGAFQNEQTSMSTPLVAGSDSSYMTAGYVGGDILPPGKYALGHFSVIFLSGMPSLGIVSATERFSQSLTGFGTLCSGEDQDNTYKLGLDWFNTAGAGASEGNAAPSASTPSRVLIESGQAIALKAEFADPDVADHLTVSVENLPEGLFPVEGSQHGGRRQLRVYGTAPSSMAEGTLRTVIWHASDGIANETLKTDLVATRPAPLDSIQASALSFIKAGHSHGMPLIKARALGARVLPYLSTLLADRAYEDHWYKILLTMAAIGDTAYFDTLRSFVWHRFHGQVSKSVYTALVVAQSNFYMFATLMPRVVPYLEQTMHTAPWLDVPWSVRGESREQVAGAMASATLTSLAYADSPLIQPIIEARAAEIRASVSPGMSRVGAMAREFRARGLVTTHHRIREKGIIAEWEQQNSSRRSR